MKSIKLILNLSIFFFNCLLHKYRNSITKVLFKKRDSNSEVILCIGTKYKLSVGLTVIIVLGFTININSTDICWSGSICSVSQFWF